MVEFVQFLIKTEEQKGFISIVSSDRAWYLTSDLPVVMDLSGELESWLNLIVTTRHAPLTLLGYCGTVLVLMRPLTCACHAVI